MIDVTNARATSKRFERVNLDLKRISVFYAPAILLECERVPIPLASEGRIIQCLTDKEAREYAADFLQTRAERGE